MEAKVFTWLQNEKNIASKSGAIKEKPKGNKKPNKKPNGNKKTNEEKGIES